MHSCFGLELLDGVHQGGVLQPVEHLLLDAVVARSASSMSAVVTSSWKRPDFTWSVTRLRAMVVNQAPMSLPCR